MLHAASEKSFAQVDISKCENTAIILTSVGTSLSTMTLVSSMAVGKFGKERHLLLVKFWTLFSVVASLFVSWLKGPKIYATKSVLNFSYFYDDL